MLNLDFYIFLTVSVLICTFGFLVYIHNPHEKINRTFFLFTITLLTWMISNYMETVVSNINIADFFIHFDFAAAAILAYTFSLFCFYFTNSVWPKNPESLFAPAILFAAFAITHNLVIKQVHFDATGRLAFSLGPLYWPYALYLFVYFGAGVCHLIRTAFHRHGEEKHKVVLVLLGLGLSAATALTMNLFFQNSVSVEIFHIGIYSMIFVVLFIAYAVIRHKMFNMRVFAAESLTVFIIVISIAQIFGSRSTIETLGRFLFFIAIFVFGLALIRSVLYEVNRREEMEKLKQELEIAYSKLKELDQAKTDFLSMASHQLRSPLTVVRLGIGALMDGTFGDLTDKRQMDALNKMLEGSTRLINLIGEYLNVSRIELGKIRYNFKEQDLCALIKDIVEEYQPRAKEKNLKLKFTQGAESAAPQSSALNQSEAELFPAAQHKSSASKSRAFPRRSIPKIKFDEEKLRHIIVNLIDNAIKYTVRGGIEVWCEIMAAAPQSSASAAGATRSRAFPAADYTVKVSIKDTGLGLKAEEIPVLFQKFRRASSGNFRRREGEPVEGSGLGLHVAKIFVEKHGGKIWAESKGEGKGSTFCFTLPLAGPPPLSPEEMGEGGKGVELPRP